MAIIIDYNLSKRELAAIRDSLNNWEWDDRLGSKPDNWDTMPNYSFHELHKGKTKYDIINPIAESIEKHIGRKECLKYHHLHNLNRTRLQFEWWWWKDIFSRWFRVGFYSRKNQRIIASVLSSIVERDRSEWVSKTYYPK